MKSPNNFFLIFSLLIIFNSCSCDKEVTTYSQWDMWAMAQKFDPKIELVGISNPESSRRIICINYGEGCVKGSGRRFLVRDVELIAIQFQTEKFAKAEARRIGQWYVKNWLFDDVTNEPVLESFVRDAFKAKPGISNEKN